MPKIEIRIFFVLIFVFEYLNSKSEKLHDLLDINQEDD